MSLPVTIASVLYRIRSKVYGAQHIELDILANDITISATQFAVTYGLTSLAPTAIISVGTELMYVWDYNTNTKTVTVTRAWNGTKAFAWTAGTELEVNVRFPSPDILNELRDEIAGWPQSLYRVVAANHTIAVFPGSVRLAPELDGLYGIIDVRRSPNPTSTTTWPRVLSVEVVHEMDPATFSTGTMLSINDALRSGSQLRVYVAMPFVTDPVFTMTTDLINEVGLAPSMVDVAILGTAIRLVMPQEIKRSSRQAADEPRLAADVPAGLALQTAMGMVRLYEKRIKEEAGKLSARVPIRF